MPIISVWQLALHNQLVNSHSYWSYSFFPWEYCNLVILFLFWTYDYYRSLSNTIFQAQWLMQLLEPCIKVWIYYLKNSLLNSWVLISPVENESARHQSVCLHKWINELSESVIFQKMTASEALYQSSHVYVLSQCCCSTVSRMQIFPDIIFLLWILLFNLNLNIYLPCSTQQDICCFHIN